MRVLVCVSDGGMHGTACTSANMWAAVSYA